MKKWIGAICSGAAGLFTLVFLALPALFVKGPIAKETYLGWELLTKDIVEGADYVALTCYRVFAWILVALAIVLIVLAALQVMAQVKGKAKLLKVLTIVSRVIICLTILMSGLALASNIGIRFELVDEMGGKEVLKDFGAKVSVSASLILITILTIAACVVSMIKFNKSANKNK